MRACMRMHAAAVLLVALIAALSAIGAAASSISFSEASALASREVVPFYGLSLSMRRAARSVSLVSMCGTFGGDTISWACVSGGGGNNNSTLECASGQQCAVLTVPDFIHPPECACTDCVYVAGRGCTSASGGGSAHGRCQIGHACTLVEPTHCTCMPAGTQQLATLAPTLAPTPVLAPHPPTPATPSTTAPPTASPTPAATPPLQPATPIALIIGLSIAAILLLLLLGVSAYMMGGRNAQPIRGEMPRQRIGAQASAMLAPAPAVRYAPLRQDSPQRRSAASTATTTTTRKNLQW